MLINVLGRNRFLLICPYFFFNTQANACVFHQLIGHNSLQSACGAFLGGWGVDVSKENKR